MKHAETVQTAEGDTVSRIAYRYYGESGGMVARILDANPGLYRHRALLPAGLTVVMPERAPSGAVPTLNLWD